MKSQRNLPEVPRHYAQPILFSRKEEGRPAIRPTAPFSIAPGKRLWLVVHLRLRLVAVAVLCHNGPRVVDTCCQGTDRRCVAPIRWIGSPGNRRTRNIGTGKAAGVGVLPRYLPDSAVP